MCSAVWSLKVKLLTRLQDGITQFGTGLIDLAVQPYKGAKQNGWLGFATGVGKGSLGTLTKTSTGESYHTFGSWVCCLPISTAALGLVSYPAQGIWKSMYRTWNSCTGRAVMRARRVHDIHFAGTADGKVDPEEIIRKFELRKPGGSDTSLPLRQTRSS